MTAGIVYFWHIPKTAGTAVTVALARSLPEHRLYPSNTLDGLWAQGADPVDRSTLFCGHFGAHLLAHLPKPPEVTFTVLRDPAEQAWSYYRFMQRIPEFDRPGGVQGRPLEELLADPVLSRLFTNLQARWLALDVDRSRWHPALEISSFRQHSSFELQDLAAHGFGMPAELLTVARSRLDSMTAVGTTDSVPAMFDRLADYDLRVAWAGERLNEAPDQQPLTNSLRRRLESVNEVDCALFEYASS